MDSIVDKTKKKMQDSLEHLKEELKSVRTGRANPLAFESVGVDVYGSLVKLKEVAHVSAADARQILITPFDPQTASAIQKSLEKANLNVKPVVDNGLVRIPIMPMDGTTREAMKKLCYKYAEEAKVRVRQARQEGNQLIKKGKADKTMPEDRAHSQEKKIQELTDEYCKKCDELAQQKEKEIQVI